uniref:Serine/threonine-protein phosphatase 6 catalytic subunit-like n=1 Tax=Salarias fasciatus TaxID=181472 RepID=A0A672IJX8_SALFA
MAPLDLDKYVEIARHCKYLPENDLKRLCDYVCDLLLEESNVQPVATPVTVCGDIHGQTSVKPSMGTPTPGGTAPRSSTC